MPDIFERAEPLHVLPPGLDVIGISYPKILLKILNYLVNALT